MPGKRAETRATTIIPSTSKASHPQREIDTALSSRATTIRTETKVNGSGEDTGRGDFVLPFVTKRLFDDLHTKSKESRKGAIH